MHLGFHRRYLNPGHHPRHYAVSRHLGQSRYGGRVSTTHYKDPRTKGSLGPGEKHITNAPKVHLSPERRRSLSASPVERPYLGTIRPDRPLDTDW
jgi:hypothetical protein